VTRPDPRDLSSEAWLPQAGPTDWEVELSAYEYGGGQCGSFEICAPLWPGDYWLESTLVVGLEAML